MDKFDLTTYSGRLAYAMHKAGKTNQSELAREISAVSGTKVTQQTIQHLVSEGKGSTHNAKLSKVLGISTLWLETGLGDMIPQNPEAIVGEAAARYMAGDHANVSIEPIAGKVPVISWVRAGQFCEAIDLYAPGAAEDWIACPTPHSKSTFALRVVGDSMTSPYPNEKSYPDGTIIFIDPEKPVFNGAKVVARVPRSNEATFKRYVEDAGRAYLMPINPNYSRIDITEEVHICGVLIGSYLPE